MIIIIIIIRIRRPLRRLKYILLRDRVVLFSRVILRVQRTNIYSSPFGTPRTAHVRHTPTPIIIIATLHYTTARPYIPIVQVYVYKRKVLLLYYHKKHLFMSSSSSSSLVYHYNIIRLHCGGGGSRFRKTVATNARKNGCLLACGRRRYRKGERKKR